MLTVIFVERQSIRFECAQQDPSPVSTMIRSGTLVKTKTMPHCGARLRRIAAGLWILFSSMAAPASVQDTRSCCGIPLLFWRIHFKRQMESARKGNLCLVYMVENCTHDDTERRWSRQVPR
jgi:hypothetical protein